MPWIAVREQTSLGPSKQAVTSPVMHKNRFPNLTFTLAASFLFTYSIDRIICKRLLSYNRRAAFSICKPRIVARYCGAVKQQLAV